AGRLGERAVAAPVEAAGAGRAQPSEAAAGEAAAREEAAVPEAVPAPLEDRRVPVRGVRRTIARRMAQAWDEVPHAAGFLEVDATALEAFRAWIGRARRDARVSPLAVVVRALAEVCRQHPAINAWYDHEAEEIVLKGTCHVGVATATDRGLLVPVVRDVGSKGLLTVAREMAEVVEAARQGRAAPEQLTGSTITITNVGSLGLDFGWPIVNFPEVAILGVGAIRERAGVVGGQVVARPSFFVSMTIDHRALDGADSARALLTLREILEDEERLRALLLD
ncbi:MAG TPA: 2-oxo acid dehydrogenase subunit E2, partial [Actinomycetota bacterium]|nr:2-oxo acid dehydrogenase subunit E2 [Actinomycetota bacterium]